MPEEAEKDGVSSSVRTPMTATPEAPTEEDVVKNAAMGADAADVQTAPEAEGTELLSNSVELSIVVRTHLLQWSAHVHVQCILRHEHLLARHKCITTLAAACSVHCAATDVFLS